MINQKDGKKLIVTYGGDLKEFERNIGSLINLASGFSYVQCIVCYWNDKPIPEKLLIDDRFSFEYHALSSNEKDEEIKKAERSKYPEYTISCIIQSIIHKKFSQVLELYKKEEGTIYCKTRSDLLITRNFRAIDLVDKAAANDAVFCGSRKFGIGLTDYMLLSSDPNKLYSVLDYSDILQVLCNVSIFPPPEVVLAFNCQSRQISVISHEGFPAILVKAGHDGSLVHRTSYKNEKNVKEYRYGNDYIETVYYNVGWVLKKVSALLLVMRICVLRIFRLL